MARAQSEGDGVTQTEKDIETERKHTERAERNRKR